MGYAYLSSAINGTTDFSNVTTGAINTSGATLLVVLISSSGAANLTPTDSQGNTWTHAQSNTCTGTANRIFYCVNPSTSASHTFSVSGSFRFPAIAAYAFSGADPSPLDVTNGHDNGTTTSAFNTGSVTPSVDNCLIVAGLCNNVSSAATIDSGFTALSYQSGGSTSQSLGTGYLIQGGAGAVNPTFSWSGACDADASIVVFKPLPPLVYPHLMTTYPNRVVGRLSVVPY